MTPIYFIGTYIRIILIWHIFIMAYLYINMNEKMSLLKIYLIYIVVKLQ